MKLPSVFPSSHRLAKADKAAQHILTYPVSSHVQQNYILLDFQRFKKGVFLLRSPSSTRQHWWQQLRSFLSQDA